MRLVRVIAGSLGSCGFKGVSGWVNSPDLRGAHSTMTVIGSIPGPSKHPQIGVYGPILGVLRV